MPLKYINELLELPELQLHKMISMTTKEVHVVASTVASRQPFMLRTNRVRFGI